MVSTNESLADKRARAADLERRVGRKFSRIKSKNDAVVAGSEFDVRKGAAVQKMRTRDIEAHIRKLEKTLDRSTQFVAGVRGAPLPVQQWRKYKAIETAVREKYESDLTPFANERLPGPGTETIGQRQKKIRTGHPTALNMGYVPPERLPFNVKDAKALVELTKSNAKRMTKKWAREEHKRAQEEFSKMVGVFKDESLNADVMGLSYGQFDMIWNLTRFADAMSLGYHHIKSKLDAKEEVPESVIKDQVAEAKSIIEWVKKFEFDPPQYGEDKFITKQKQKQMDGEMSKRGYGRVGKQYYKR